MRTHCDQATRLAPGAVFAGPVLAALCLAVSACQAPPSSPPLGAVPTETPGAVPTAAVGAPATPRETPAIGITESAITVPPSAPANTALPNAALLDAAPPDAAAPIAPSPSTPTAFMGDTPPAASSPTTAPSPTATPIPTATAPPAAQTTATVSPEGAASAAPGGQQGGAGRSDALPRSLAGVHFAGNRYAAAEVFGGGAGAAGWAVELAYASDGDPASVAQRMVALSERGFQVILRIDHARGQHIPPSGEAAEVARYVDFIAEVVAGSGGRLRHVVVGNEGNIDEVGDVPRRNTECRLGRDTCAPEAYAAVYRAVRQALRPRFGTRVLVAGVSPGDEDHPARWMSGPDYLDAVLRLLLPGEVDGLALHAYGLERAPVPGLPPEPLAYFKALMERQLGVMAATGHARTPIYITEMNEYTRPEADFVRGSYAWLDSLNRAGRARVLAACWFVLDGGAPWSEVALASRPDILAVFREVALAYPPGR